VFVILSLFAIVSSVIRFTVFQTFLSRFFSLDKIKDRVTRTPLKIKLALIDNADSGVKRKL
jgi:hypothetical protein